MSKKNIIIIAVVVIIVLVIIAGGVWYFMRGNGAGGANATVATVNGTAITEGQLADAETQITSQDGVVATSTDAQSQLQSQALDSLISEQLLEQAAAAAGIVASSTEVDAQIQAAKTQLGSDTAYQQALAAQGMTEDDLRAQIASGLAINAYLDQTLNLSSITATDAEIQSAYDAVASQETGVPPLDQVRDQVEQSVIQQKQQPLIDAQIAKLRAAANVQILIK